MSAHILLNLLNKLGKKRFNARSASISLLFRKKFNK